MPDHSLAAGIDYYLQREHATLASWPQLTGQRYIERFDLNLSPQIIARAPSNVWLANDGFANGTQKFLTELMHNGYVTFRPSSSPEFRSCICAAAPIDRSSGRRAGRLRCRTGQVARPMVDQGIREANRSKKPFTTKADPAAVRASNLVNRSFSGRDPAPRRLEVGAVDDDASRSRRAEHGGVDPSAQRTLADWCVLCDAGSQGEFQWSSQHLEMDGWRRAFGNNNDDRR